MTTSSKERRAPYFVLGVELQKGVPPLNPVFRRISKQGGFLRGAEPHLLTCPGIPRPEEEVKRFLKHGQSEGSGGWPSRTDWGTMGWSYGRITASPGLTVSGSIR